MIKEVKIIINWLSEEEDENELNQYRLRIYWLSWFKAIVVASNITNLPGKKISDNTARIICLVADCFDLFPSNIMLVEHYPGGNLLDRDVYFHVLLKNNETARHRISKDELMRLIYYST